MSDKKKVFILGAGPVGLICGWLLSLKNWDVKVFEMKNSVGGMCRSWRWKSHILDTGPHIFHTSDKGLIKFWKKNFSELLQTGKFYSRNVINKNFSESYAYPLSYEAIKKYPSKLKNKIFNELKETNKNLEARNFKEFVENQVGETLTSMFFEGYPKKVWGISTKRMTADWAPKRIKITKKTEPFFQKEFTAVGKKGTGAVYEKIAKKLVKSGGKIYLNSKVSNIDYNEKYITDILVNDKTKFNVNDKDIIISTLPITHTAAMLGFKSDLRFRGIRSIYVSLNKKRVLPKNTNWLYFADKGIIFNRVSEPPTMCSNLTSAGKTYITAEITYQKNDKIDKLSYESISKIVINDLIKTNLIKKNDVIGISENKEDFVYPVQFVNYKSSLAKAKQQVEKFNQLYSLGTGGDFDYSDSQILFHKSLDLVDILNQKNNLQTQVKKNIEYSNLNQVVKLGKKVIGENFPAYIIAEAGLNHNGNLKTAKKLIDSAKKANCDAIKFQTFSASSRISKKVKSVKYSEKADGLREDLHEMFDRLSLSKKEFEILFKYARKKKVEIFSTPFSIDDVNFLEKHKVKFYKIASVDCVNLPLIERVGKTKKPLILSTGMTDLSLVEDAVKTFKSTGNKNLILLHCLSAYPSNEKEMNLNAIKTLKKIYNVPVGLSDHYPGLEVSYMALGIGANIIERHFTLNKGFEGPDHILSSEPEDMKKLTAMANNSLEIFGDGQKKIQPSEYFVINSQRKCLYAKNKIKKGQTILKKNIIIKGPAGGVLPKHIDIICGKKAKLNIEKDEPITWESI